MLIITGTMGSGKTSVLGEAADLLASRDTVHAAIDLDALGFAHLPSAADNDDVMYRNLQAVCANYAALDVHRVLLARAIENRDDLERCRAAVAAASTVVCRLTASVETMEQRVKIRESGISQQYYVARVARLNAILDRACLQDFTISNENRSLTEVAQEILVMAGWI